MPHRVLVSEDDLDTGHLLTVQLTEIDCESKIERDPANPTHILTVWGLGYRFATRGA